MLDEKYEKYMGRQRTDKLNQDLKELFMINKEGGNFSLNKRRASKAKDDTNLLSSSNGLLTKMQETRDEN